jgi:hypothetical protein
MADNIPNDLKGFNIRDIFIYQDAQSQETSYFYIPGIPQPQLDQNNEPDVQIEVSNKGANVSMKTFWAVDKIQRDRLISEIAAKKQIQADKIALKPGEINQPKIHLTIGNGTQTVQSLNPISAQATDPFQANIQETLTAIEKGNALPAFNGDVGHMMVTYTSLLNVTSRVKASIAGDLAEDIRALIPKKKKDGSLLGGFFGKVKKGDSEEQEKDITLEDCQVQIEKALQTGRLKFSYEESSNVPDALRQEVDMAVKADIVNILLSKVKEAIALDVSLDKYDVDKSHEETQSRTYPIERTADVGTWFQRIDGTGHIKDALAPIPDPVREKPSDKSTDNENSDVPITNQSIDVVLDFNAQKLHDFNGKPIVSEIKITGGNQTKILQEPDFAPVRLSLTAPVLLTIETQFNLGASFIHQVSVSGSKLALTPDMLGVIEIVVDGSAFKKARAKQAIIQVDYLPTAQGVREVNRQISFRATDNEWIKRWFAITRSTNLGGSIKWSWNVTPATGLSVKQDQVTTTNPNLIFKPVN